jgi:predicted GNAT family acetyltransferase
VLVRFVLDVEEFVQEAGAFLSGAAERNVLATVTDTVLAHSRSSDGVANPYGTEPAIFALGIDSAAGEVVAAALRTPPYPMLATGFGDADAAEQLISAWLARDPQLPGVSAQTSTARAICDAWARRVRGVTELAVSEAMHDLTAVVMPADPPGGALRLVTPGERALLVSWLIEFSIEAHMGDASRAELMADLGIDGQRVYFWEDPDPVSVVGHALAVGDVMRVGPVYTPPACRGRGYASAAVASLSQRLLDDGASRCMLFTDLSNPTSNKIYDALGYRRFADWEERRFLPHSGALAPAATD